MVVDPSSLSCSPPKIHLVSCLFHFQDLSKDVTPSVTEHKKNRRPKSNEDSLVSLDNKAELSTAIERSIESKAQRRKARKMAETQKTEGATTTYRKYGLLDDDDDDDDVDAYGDEQAHVETKQSESSTEPKKQEKPLRSPEQSSLQQKQRDVVWSPVSPRVCMHVQCQW